MRTQLLFGLALAACSVPDKSPLGGDGGTGDGGGISGPLETEITNAPGEFSNERLASFEFKSNVAAAKFECSVDGAAAEMCTSPFAQNLDDGTHSFSVRATDGAGTEDATPAEHLWTIDTVAPDTTLLTAPPVADNSTMVTFEFKSNEMNITFECSLDNGAFAACKSGDSVGPIADGAHAFSVRAKDRAGNVDASPAVHAWAVDTSTPDTTLTSGPVGSAPDGNATFEFVSPDAGPGATFQCSLDNAAFTSCTSPMTYTNLPMATHTFAVRVTDGVGNVDPTPATRTWIVDLTPPETTISAGPSGAVALASVSFTFTANEDSTFTCSLDGAPFTDCTSPANFTGLSQGNHTFAVRATDLVGHADASPATASWTVDTIPPDLEMVAGPTNGTTVGPRIVFMWTVDSATTIECRMSSSAPWMPCDSPFGYNETAGPGYFDVRGTDAAGNSSTLTRNFTIACAAPDTAGALGVLHLDDTTQDLANATGGAGATLGTSHEVEASDPVTTSARFGTGLAFTASEGDLVAWPLAAGTSADLTAELWASPAALAGTRDILASGDSRMFIRVSPAGANMVRFVASAVDTGGVIYNVASADVTAGALHHVLVSLSTQSLRMWVDGKRTENSDVSLSAPPSLDSIRLGGSYSGTIDEVYLAPSAITDNEVALARFCPVSGFVL
jgi:hypothetical protein